MSNSYRIRTKPGVDSSIKILIDQEFEYLEILSLKILQSQIYTRTCSDYGVIVGRVSVNNGFGIPNAKVSVFIPLDSIDEDNPVITDIYPYKTLTDVNEDGYRYNLLPYKQQHSGHKPTGTFFTREDVLTNPTLIQVYDKYFKYTAITNDSGDYMIFGVPVGSQTIVVDVDLSDIGEFSLSPQDLVRMGVATEKQVSGTKFKSSTNLRELPQIVTINRTIEVEPLWGQPEICNLGITRTDFDLSGEANIDIRPTAIFMGSLISSNDDSFLKRNCKSLPKAGTLCDLVAGPGEILAIRQTIQKDIVGRPLLEQFDLDEGGQVIDENGTWLIDVPMNLDYVVTNEFGEQVLSDDPEVGIPTKGKYRFKVKWNQSPSLTADPVKRGYYLVPNIKEYGWTIDNNGDKIDPTIAPTTQQQIQNYVDSQNSYAFSVDWNEYGDTGTTIGQQMIQEAINCEDRFYEFQYNKVYTVSQLITRYRKGYDAYRIIGVKDILDSECESETYKFPTNDGYLQFDIIYLLFTIVMFVFRPILYNLLIVLHVLALLMLILNPILKLLVSVVFVIIVIICGFVDFLVFWDDIDCPNIDELGGILDKVDDITNAFSNIQIPVLSYPTCEFCSCEDGVPIEPNVDALGLGDAYNTAEETGALGVLSKFSSINNYSIPNTLPFNYDTDLDGYQSLMAGSAKNTNNPTISSRVPVLQTLYQSSNDDWDTKVAFTTSLTISERLNLFNTKAKFFEGVNQIKSCFNTVDNPSDFHYDNVIAILINQSYVNTFSTGNIVTFQDPTLSSDPNLTGYTLGNLFGTNAITGTTINNSGTQFTVSSSDPNNPLNTITVNYISRQDPNDATYARFPIDVEYFQVITGMTLNDYSLITGTTLSNSLPSRFIFNSMRFYQIDRQQQSTPIVFNVGNWINYDTNGNPLLLDYTTAYNNFLNQQIVFLVRGVDPNSTRSDCSYDLSKLFGYNTWGQVVVSGKYKLNVPIQGGYKNVQHNLLNNTDTNAYSNTELYYDSYHFAPAPSTNTAGFTAFTSNLPSYYSKLDNTNLGIGIVSDSTKGAVIDVTNNRFVREISTPNINPVNILTPILNTAQNARGYYPSEVVEGGSAFYSTLPPFNLGLVISSTPNSEPVIDDGSYQIVYTAQRYPSTTVLNYGLGVSGRQIVMRSDRLPTSTTTDNNLTNSFPLHTNLKFVAFQINDDGTNVPPTGVNGNMGISLTGATLDSLENDYSSGSIAANVVQSSQCGSMVPLGCYSSATINGVVNFGTKPLTDSCFKDPIAGGTIFAKGGCYVFVTTPFLSLPKDFLLLTEWVSRLLIIFGACRNVFGHIFTNNWINGTLYSFTFKNDVFYTSPFASNPNQATYNYCKDVVTLHGQYDYAYTGGTNNFYYRSSPYEASTNSFIGAPQPSPPSFLGINFPGYGGNDFNLNYPTTLMDLGPRTYYMQELVMSDDYDGYVANKLVNTTYSDVSDLLNLFILTRLANNGFLAQILNGNNILTYFTRNNLMIDGDYAQSISVNSELGVSPFDPFNYPDSGVPGVQNPVYINTLSTFSDQIFGVFFSSDTQTRDYISPKRTIINPLTQPNNICTFNNFRVFTQEVPFYQWLIKKNSFNPGNIFGSQDNEWYANPIDGSTFFTHGYQSLDRVNQSSRYTRTNNINQSQYFKGYIYSVDGSGNISASPTTVSPNNPEPDSSGSSVTVGAPYHFYFGLKRGKSAFDRFTTKWVDTNKIVL
jgi:hypothetical protein